MSIPMIPVPPMGTGSVDGRTADDESQLPTENLHLDDGESNDDEATVDEDVRDAQHINDNLEK